MPTYRYTGPVQTAFVDLVKDGATWSPEYGDTIETVALQSHPWLEEVTPEADEKESPAAPEPTTSPAAADEPKEK